jgi:alkylation response protein AidB-like acyl-CoA dehydrogenase
LAQRAIDAAVRYAKERVQFGKPIAKFQLIQSMIADMMAETDAARLLAYRALLKVQKGVRCARETSIAKFYATEAAVKVTSTAIQIHGAYGLSKEYAVERLFRGARMMTIPDGTTQIQKLIVGREILGMQAFV